MAREDHTARTSENQQGRIVTPQLLASMGLPEVGSAFNWRTRPAAIQEPAPKRERATPLTEAQLEYRREWQRNYSRTPEGIANRNAARQRARLLAAATRINPHALAINKRTQADIDKIGALTGRGTPNGFDK